MNQLHFLRAATLGAAFALSGATSHAQPALGETPAVNAANAIETVDIRVKNIPVGLAAYWLDPAHQRVPQQIQSSLSNGGAWMREADRLPRQPGNANGPHDLKLPAGIESITSIEPQNILMIKGTAAGIEELKKLLTELDVPIKQVEIEAQFCQMSPQTLKTLPLKFETGEVGSHAPSVALVPPTVNLSAVLTKLIAANKVRVITAPRMTSMDGLTAQLQSTETRPFMLSPLNEKWTTMSEADRQWFPGIAMVQMETGFTCTPIFHDDSIKLFTRSTLNDRGANVNFNVRDGQTIAIAMPVDKSEANNRTVIFVTTRVIRRAGDETARAPEMSAPKLGLIG